MYCDRCGCQRTAFGNARKWYARGERKYKGILERCLGGSFCSGVELVDHWNWRALLSHGHILSQENEKPVSGAIPSQVDGL